MRISPISSANFNSRKINSGKPKTTTGVSDQNKNINFKGYIEKLYNSGDFSPYLKAKVSFLFEDLWKSALEHGRIYNRRAVEIFQSNKYDPLEYKLARMRDLNLDYKDKILEFVSVDYNNGLYFHGKNITFAVDKRLRLSVIEPHDELYFHGNGNLRKYTHHSSDYTDTYSVRYNKDGSSSFLNNLPLGF